MTSRIFSLDPHVANQIAAGEVIERPASVIKELLENALDAGADALCVEIGFGGLNHMKVSDNGWGIVADDLHLAIAPHATSKLSMVQDLSTLTSMGFRGEALASIASVSRLSLHSKPASQDHGMILSIHEDGGVRIEPSPRHQGTSVEVRDLFFNTPVRKSFLKSERLEFQAIEAVVKRFALSAPHVAIILKHNDKVTLTLAKALCATTRRARVQALFGKTFMDNALYLDETHEQLRLEGWISGPHDQRSQHDKQWIYLNQRMIKDKLIQHALMQAYQPLLRPGRYPACVLYFTVPTHEVDINVHPTKHEVRFQQARLVHDFIQTRIAHVLQVPLPVYVPPLTCVTASTDEIREPATRRYTPAARPLEKPWHVLNAHYALSYFSLPWHATTASPQLVDPSCSHEIYPYVVHVEGLFHHYACELLQQAKKPLASRPLLVPVRYTLDHVNPQTLHEFLSWGYEFVMLSDTSVMVRTVPVLFPWLDPGLIFTEGRAHLAPAECLKQCILAQAVDIRSWDLALHRELAEYWLHHLLISEHARAYAKPFDLQHCRAFIYE